MGRNSVIDRAIIFVPKGHKAAANGFAQQVGTDLREDLTFGSVKLSPSGNLPETHYAAATGISQEGLDMLVAAKPQLPGSQYYLESEGWTWETAKADIGLVSIDEGV